MIPSKEQFEFEFKHKDLINTFTLEELYWINQMAVARIKLIHILSDLAETSKFRKGEKVTWRYIGWIRRVNPKTITVTETQEDKQRNIHPTLLTKVV